MVRRENDDDVRDAVVADIVDEMEKITIKTPAQEAEENVTASPPSSCASCTLCSYPVQKSAFSCKLPDAGSHIQRTLHVFREAIRKSNATAQRQMLITEMLPKRT